jgi:4-hydroxybenzoate polyprenyltransferase
MPAVKTYMTLFRVSNLPTIWSNVLTALLLCNAPFSWTGMITLVLSLSLFYCGGMVFNDICDAEIDSLQRPSRPIPSGKISRREASKVAALLFISACALLLTTPHPVAAALSGMLLLACILLYDLFHKGNPLSVLLMAACRFMVYAVAGYAVTGSITCVLLTIGLIQFSYIILVSLTARYENKRPKPFPIPVIPLMLAGICIIDSIFLSFSLSIFWLSAGICGAVITLCGQRYVRGD